MALELGEYCEASHACFDCVLYTNASAALGIYVTYVIHWVSFRLQTLASRCAVIAPQTAMLLLVLVTQRTVQSVFKDVAQ